jgi:SulP family sulfate permease
MGSGFAFNRLELAGSLGDLGTLLPMAIAMVLICGLDPVGTFAGIGLFYVLAGWYYRVTMPVQPMKVIGAYAIGASLSAGQLQASALLVGVLLLVVGGTGIMDRIRSMVPLNVIRGVQLSTGILLMAKGVSFMAGTSSFQVLQGAVEPALTVQSVGPIPVSLVLGLAVGVVTFRFLDNTRYPAGLLAVGVGAGAGLLLGAFRSLAELDPGLYLPSLFPFGVPSAADFGFVFLTLVLPQLPMTVGNAVIANADLSHQYFGEKSGRVTPGALCMSMGLANLGAFVLGGMPMCHGAGGLAAHYRFGARTAGSNLMIGAVFLVLALVFGPGIMDLFALLPLSVLGVLLVFAGSQLGLTILDMHTRKDLFVCLLILAIAWSTNLAVGFLAGIAVSKMVAGEKFSI